MSKFLEIGATMAQCECLNCTSKYTKLYSAGQAPSNLQFHNGMNGNGWLAYSIMFAGKWYLTGLCAACKQKLGATVLSQSGGDMQVKSSTSVVMLVPRSIWLGQVYKMQAYPAVPSPYQAIVNGAKKAESKDSGELTKLVREMMTQFHDSDKVPDTYQYQLTVEFGTLRKIAKLI